jgi:hypothetical protein
MQDQRPVLFSAHLLLYLTRWKHHIMIMVSVVHGTASHGKTHAGLEDDSLKTWGVGNLREASLLLGCQFRRGVST